MLNKQLPHYIVVQVVYVRDTMYNARKLYIHNDLIYLKIKLFPPFLFKVAAAGSRPRDIPSAIY